MNIALPTALHHILEVYRLVRLSHRSRINAIKEVAHSRRIDPQTVTSACTRSLGINTDDFDALLQCYNAESFCEHLVRRFPPYQKEIEDFFSHLEGKQNESDDDPTRIIRTLFPDEKKDLLRLLILNDIKKRFLLWSNRVDIPLDLKIEIDELKKRIDST